MKRKFSLPSSTNSPIKTFVKPAIAITTFCETEHGATDCISCGQKQTNYIVKVFFLQKFINCICLQNIKSCDMKN